MSDNVHNPAHYTAGGIETIDFIRAKLGPEGFRAYCLGNVLKYVSRHAHKNGDEDLHKASVYLGWAMDFAPILPRTVEVPVVGMVTPGMGIASLKESERLALAERAFDDEEPSLRAFSSGDRL